MEETLQKRLLYAKILFEEGCKILDQGMFLAEGRAILHFQDAAEMMLRIIASKTDAQFKKNKMSFALYWDQIRTAPRNENNKPVPLKINMLELNEARVSFKHYGNLPTNEDCEKFRKITRRFFELCLDKFFDLEYEDISLADIVKHQRARNFLKKAESYYVEEDYKNSITCSGKAFKLLLLNTRVSYRDLFHSDYRFYDTHLGSKLAHYDEMFKMLIFRVDLSNYLKFTQIIPNIGLMETRLFRVYFHGEELMTKENAKFCLNFVIDSALQIQNRRLHFETPVDKKLAEVRVIKDKANIIVYPLEENDKDFEVIREAEKGEILEKYYHYAEVEGYLPIFQDDDIAYINKSDVEDLSK